MESIFNESERLERVKSRFLRYVGYENRLLNILNGVTVNNL